MAKMKDIRNKGETKMKKLFALLTASLLVFAVGCSQSSGGSSDDGANKEEKNTDKAASEEEGSQAQASSALMQFELDLVSQLHKAAEPFIGIAALAEVEKKDFDPKELKSLVEQANTSATDFAKRVKGLEVPADLSEETKSKVEGALTDLAANFETRATEIQKLAEAKNPKEVATKWETFTKAVTPKLESFTQKMNEVHKELGLSKTDYVSELQ